MKISGSSVFNSRQAESPSLKECIVASFKQPRITASVNSQSSESSSNNTIFAGIKQGRREFRAPVRLLKLHFPCRHRAKAGKSQKRITIFCDVFIRRAFSIQYVVPLSRTEQSRLKVFGANVRQERY